nr:FG-GAP repeat protein [Xenococcaceae cyanobacterium MO_167.B52]
SALTAADFNNDGFDDLVVGIPGESPGSDPKSGAIAVLNGSANGLVGSRSFDQESLGLGDNEDGDLFGSALAVGDFNNDGFDDLVIGAPGESPGDDERSGTITVLNGSANGLVASRTFEQENLGLGSNEAGDLFGSALTAADFNNDGFDDLVVGIPGESPGSDPKSGAIAVLNGSASGLVGSRSFDQENLGLGSNEAGDSFGFAVASNREDNDNDPNPNPNPPTPDPDGNPDTLELYRFRNTTFDLGTYLFVGRQERDAIVANPNLNQIFELEGNGAVAFVGSSKPGDDLVPFYRFRNLDISGTYLFVGEEERKRVKENFSEQFTEEGLAFYAFGAGTNRGLPFNRFQNKVNNTYLFAAPTESAIIRNDSDLSNVFIEEGAAFEGLI